MDGHRPNIVQRHRPHGGNVNWPLWVVLGVFALGVVGFLVQTGARRVRPAKPRSPARPLADAEGFIKGSEPLHIGCCYCLSQRTPLCRECGVTHAMEQPQDRKFLEAGTHIGIVGEKTMDGVRWYQVEAVASDGKTQLGRGWINAPSLADQYLRLLR